jgi:tRNA threonylcarbamoyladenosine biosynthesis protein TsaB
MNDLGITPLRPPFTKGEKQGGSEDKPILAIESSENLCGACVYFSDDKYFESNVQLKNAHSEKIYEGIDYVINSAGIQIKDLSHIAVSSGPGSFTGLRIGMSAAKGIAFGASLPIVPVPTFEALALQINSFLIDGTNFIIANKVKADEVYFAKFQIKSNSYIFTESLKIIEINELKSEFNSFPVFGNALVNDKNKAKINISAPFPLYVAKWSKLFGKDLLTSNYDYLEPNYLKNFIFKES